MVDWQIVARVSLACSGLSIFPSANLPIYESHMLDVIGVGTNSVDDVIQLAGELSAVLASSKARVTSRHLIMGGQTATVAAACATLGLRTGYIGAFGSDPNGQPCQKRPDLA